MRNKIFAILLGPAGYGIVAQINNFMNLSSVAIGLGAPVGLTIVIPSHFKNKENESSLKIILDYYYLFTVFFAIISVLFSVIFIIFSDQILISIIGENSFHFVFIASMVSLPFVIVYKVIEAFLRSMDNISTIVRISIISSLISIAFLSIFLLTNSLPGIAVYLLIINSIPLIIFYFFYRKSITNYFGTLKYSYRKINKKILSVGLQSMYSNFLHLGALLLVRKLIIDFLGLENNGLYQSILGISLSGFAIIYIFLTNYTLPQLSSFENDSSICSELNNNFRFLLFLITPLVLLIFTFKETLVLILFSESFSPVVDLIHFQLLGDYFRGLAALMGLWLISKAKVKELIVFNTLFNLVFIISPLFFLNFIANNIIFLPIAYLLTFIVQFLLYMSYSYKSINFRFAKIVLTNFITSILIIFIGFYISYSLGWISYILNPLIILFWLYISLTKEEIIKIRGFDFKKLR